MEIKDRIKEVRKDSGLSQAEFAKKLGTVQNTITGYETGRRNPSGSASALICEKFNVNRDWLISGEGKKYSVEFDNFMDAITDIDKDDPEARQAILDYWNLSPDDKKLFWNFVKKFIQK